MTASHEPTPDFGDRMGRARGLSVLMAVNLLFCAATARAQGFAVQGFDPAPPGDRFFGVSDAQVRGLLDGHAALVGSYALRPLRGYTLADGAEFITQQLWVHPGLALALADTGLLSVDVPIDLVERGDPGYATEPESGKLGDIRATLRAALAGDHWKKWSLGAELHVYIPSGDQEALVGDGMVRAAPHLAFSGELQNLGWALNAGYLFRKHEDVLLGEVGSAITFGGGAALSLLRQSLQLGVEVYGHSVTATELFSDRGTLVEAVFGPKLRAGNLVIGAGVGHGFTEAPGSAALRVLLSLGLSRDERVLDRDGDGLYDDHDGCPGEPGFENNGCPAADHDGDTIVDARDACPTRAGLVHADPKKNGCPPS